MRIIDNKHDFYDYLQDPTDTLVFDRRNSFILTKEMVCNEIDLYDSIDYCILLLQCGSTFWSFLLTVTERSKKDRYSYRDSPTNYKLELISTWKNYDKPRQCISFKMLRFGYTYRRLLQSNSVELDFIKNLKNAIEHNEYEIEGRVSLDTYTDYSGKKHNIPILSACGVSQIVDPVEVFTAIEEYFSMEKTASERIEPIGGTNNDKIIMHGFDTKTSFRGKNK